MSAGLRPLCPFLATRRDDRLLLKVAEGRMRHPLQQVADLRSKVRAFEPADLSRLPTRLQTAHWSSWAACGQGLVLARRVGGADARAPTKGAPTPLGEAGPGTQPQRGAIPQPRPTAWDKERPQRSWISPEGACQIWARP